MKNWKNPFKKPLTQLVFFNSSKFQATCLKRQKRFEHSCGVLNSLITTPADFLCRLKLLLESFREWFSIHLVFFNIDYEMIYANMLIPTKITRPSFNHGIVFANLTYSFFLGNIRNIYELHSISQRHIKLNI